MLRFSAWIINKKWAREQQIYAILEDISSHTAHICIMLKIINCACLLSSATVNYSNFLKGADTFKYLMSSKLENLERRTFLHVRDKNGRLWGKKVIWIALVLVPPSAFQIYEAGL